MKLSKKEISILIEITFSILFSIIFLPFFYKNRETVFVLSDLMGKVTEIIIFVVVYFSVTYSVLEYFYKNKITEDERDDMINSKSYKLGYLLYELSLFVLVGHMILNSSFNAPFNQNGGVIFLILFLILVVSVTKSIYQFYLHRTF